ncbi:MAG: alpha/beta hydrolase [Candidatus Eremiobacteraeota bacterium]|nr:alpha/beta hydrolase [Candidatus Eremiobacteraeota bacterium]
MLTKTERRITLGDGAQTTIETWGERGPLILCVHGMTSSRRSWERLARHLDGRFRVAAYDQRGHGDSAGVIGPMGLERGIRDASEIAAALEEPIDGLVGHSWGGAVAIEAGRRLPVSRIAAIDPMIRQVNASWYAEYLEELNELFALEGDVRDAKTRVDFADWHPLDVEAKVHAVHTMTTAPIEGLLRENPPESWDLRTTIARYEKPLLLAIAARGESINDDAALREIEINHSPSVEIAVFPGAGHNLHRTAFDRFAQVFDAWLGSEMR